MPHLTYEELLPYIVEIRQVEMMHLYCDIPLPPETDELAMTGLWTKISDQIKSEEFHIKMMRPDSWHLTTGGQTTWLPGYMRKHVRYPFATRGVEEVCKKQGWNATNTIATIHMLAGQCRYGQTGLAHILQQLVGERRLAKIIHYDEREIGGVFRRGREKKHLKCFIGELKHRWFTDFSGIYDGWPEVWKPTAALYRIIERNSTGEVLAQAKAGLEELGKQS